MTLTEEQRAALKRVAAYMDEMYSVASPYHGCTEDSDLLRAMIDSSEHVTEPTKMIGFDLERIKADLGDIGDPRFCDCEVRTQLAAAIAEIERLQAEIAIIRKREAHNTKQDAIRAEQQAARIKELEASWEELCDRIQEKEARIQELEDALVEKQTQLMPTAPSCYAEARRRAAINQLQAEGKIGPDAKPRVWQITEERVGLLEYCLETLLDAPDIEEIPGPGHSIEVLRAMLEEAGQE